MLQIPLLLHTDRSGRLIRIPELRAIGKRAAIQNPESLKKRIEMTQYCRENLTIENYGPLPSGERIACGFYYASHTSSIEDMKLDVEELCKKTGRKFRLGTPFELLWYMSHRYILPKFFISVSHVWNKKVLFWFQNNFGTKFHLWHDEIDAWRVDCGIFVVEEI